MKINKYNVRIIKINDDCIKRDISALFKSLVNWTIIIVASANKIGLFENEIL